MSRDGERGGILARIRRFFSSEGPAPEASAPTLFTATRFPSSAAPPEPSEPLFSAAPARERDLWDEVAEGDEDDGEVSVAALTDELSRLVEDDEPEPLFASHHPRPQVTDAGDGPAVNIHGERIDTRPGPIRMTPSEALALAKDGPAALRRRRAPG